MRKTVANLPASVRQRLLNLATERKEDFGLVLTRYRLERFLYASAFLPIEIRLSSRVLCYCKPWTAETYRPTRDLGLLGRGVCPMPATRRFRDHFRWKALREYETNHRFACYF